MSSRVRLARNIKDASFPGWAKKPERVRVLELIRPAIEGLPEMKDAFSETMDSLSTLDKTILVERHLISREHRKRSGPESRRNPLLHDQRRGPPSYAGAPSWIAAPAGMDSHRSSRFG